MHCVHIHYSQQIWSQHPKPDGYLPGSLCDHDRPRPIADRKGKVKIRRQRFAQMPHKRQLPLKTATLARYKLYSSEVATELSVLGGLLRISFRATQEKQLKHFIEHASF